MTRRPAPRWVWWVLSTAACALVFSAYLQPEVVIDFGNRLIACF